MRHTSSRLLIQALKSPDHLARLSRADLDIVLRYAECCGVLAALGQRAAECATLSSLPPRAQDRIDAASLWAKEQARALRWETRAIAAALSDFAAPVLILKGGAYLLGGFASARGRLVSDLDLMVPAAAIDAAEQALLAAGYQYQKVDDYDQHYYRQWMHELPPLFNPHRGLVVDLHHNIAPPVGRLKIPAKALFERAVPLAEGFLRLGDEDLVLHLCVHMFNDGELNNVLRELLDLEGALQTFARDAGFWDRLATRARELGLQRPLFYGLSCCAQLLGTSIPASMQAKLKKFGPLWPQPVLAAMRSGILPETFDQRSRRRALAVNALYWRSHWMRMPPLMLARHLFTQFRRRGGFKRGEEVPVQQQ